MRKTLFIIALLGLLVSSYLAVEYVSNGPILCVQGGGCDAVRASSYAHMLGLPTPLYGVAFYILLEIGAILLVPGRHLKYLRWGLTALTGAGLAMSLWLTYIEAFILKAWCTWCLASAILAALAFIFVWFKLPKHEI